MEIINLCYFCLLLFSFCFQYYQLFYCCSITVVCIFSPPLYPTSLPCFHLTPWFCPCVLYSSSWKPFSPLSILPSPLAVVRLFLSSLSLLIFCLLFSSVDYVPGKGEIIGYLYLTAWLASLSIMLPTYIHVVAKGVRSWPTADPWHSQDGWDVSAQQRQLWLDFLYISSSMHVLLLLGGGIIEHLYFWSTDLQNSKAIVQNDFLVIEQ